MLIDIFIPCYIDQLQPEIGFKMVDLLKKTGCEVIYNEEQTCCGNPAFTSGYWDECKVVGEKLIKEFNADRYIVCPSNLCTHTVKDSYTNLFYNSALHNEYKQVNKNFYEFSNFVVNVLKFTQFDSTFSGKAVFMNSCFGSNGCKISEEPLKLLQQIKNLELIALNDNECCGLGGGFSLKYENLSVELAKRKVDAVLQTGAKYIISSDYSCLINLNAYIKKNNIDLTCKHIVEIL